MLGWVTCKINIRIEVWNRTTKKYLKHSSIINKKVLRSKYLTIKKKSITKILKSISFNKFLN